jgi:hypothetical protein
MTIEVPVLGHQSKNPSAHCTARVNEWPQIMRGDLAWDSQTLPSDEDTILSLTEDEVEEVKAAVQHFNRERP